MWQTVLVLPRTVRVTRVVRDAEVWQTVLVLPRTVRVTRVVRDTQWCDRLCHAWLTVRILHGHSYAYVYIYILY